VLKSETVSALTDLVSAEIVEQVFCFYCNNMQGGKEDEFSLDTDRVCRWVVCSLFQVKFFS